ncbi:hypothetical protein F5051DRAFT_446968 [Lentinula edodes]|nr:hypothetical protein F5051DRAFT_446968 [Lentinula edodes]
MTLKYDGPPWTLQEPLQGSHLSIPATTRSFPSSVAVSIAPFELQPAPSTLQPLREANLKSHQYLCQLLRRQEDDHAQIISMDTRMAIMGMEEGSATAGPSRRTAERRRLLKRRRIVEESEEEGGEEEDRGVEEKETVKDGEGEEGTAPTEAQSEKGKEKAVE